MITFWLFSRGSSVRAVDPLVRGGSEFAVVAQIRIHYFTDKKTPLYTTSGNSMLQYTTLYYTTFQYTTVQSGPQG